MMQPQRHIDPARVLCVDDDPYLTDLLRYALLRDGHSVRVANTAADAIKAVAAERPDVVILDVRLPDTDGFTLCAHLRSTYRVPVILVTARSSDEDVLVGFDRGADDYIGKPFNMQVLIYRVRAVLRRARGAVAEPPVTSYRLGGSLFNPQLNEIVSKTKSVKLTPIESKILRLLLVHEGQVLSANHILEHVWDYDSESNSLVVKTHIRHLRVKVAEAIGDVPIIHTVARAGYTLRRNVLHSLRDESLPEELAISESDAFGSAAGR